MGELFALLSALCFSMSNVTIGRGVEAEGGENGAFLSIVVTAAISGSVWLVQIALHGAPVLHLRSVLWFAGAGILTIFIGRVFYYASIQQLGSVRGSAVKRLNPLFSVVLGVLLLGESIEFSMMCGMALIIASFVVLIRQSMRASAIKRVGKQAQTWSERLGGLGFVYGPVSALAYAFGYVARKEGMVLMPDAAFGTMLGSVVGALMFLAMAQIVPSYRTSVRLTFTVFNPWLLGAGVLSTAGQMLYFMALSYSTISKVAMIGSIEAILTIMLTVIVTRSFKQLNGPVLLAAGLGVAGTMLIVVRW